MGQAEERISESEDRKFLHKNEKRTISEKNPRAVRQYRIAWHKSNWMPEGKEREWGRLSMWTDRGQWEKQTKQQL